MARRRRERSPGKRNAPEQRPEAVWETPRCSVWLDGRELDGTAGNGVGEVGRSES